MLVFRRKLHLSLHQIIFRAMSFLVMGMASKRAVTIDDGSPITTSFPSFESLMAQIGANFQKQKQ